MTGVRDRGEEASPRRLDQRGGACRLGDVGFPLTSPVWVCDFLFRFLSPSSLTPPTRYGQGLPRSPESGRRHCRLTPQLRRTGSPGRGGFSLSCPIPIPPTRTCRHGWSGRSGKETGNRVSHYGIRSMTYFVPEEDRVGSSWIGWSCRGVGCGNGPTTRL